MAKRKTKQGKIDGVIIEEIAPMRAISSLNAPSTISRAIHSGMMKQSERVDENVVFAPAGMVGIKHELPSPLVIKEKRPEQEALSCELKVARKQIEIDDKEKESLKETIMRLQKKIKELEARPIVTEDMQLELAAYHRYKRKSRERERRFVERHSKE